MQPITIRLPDEIETDYRRRAAAAKKQLSVFLRDQLLEATPPEQELNRATLEAEIDALKKEIEALNNAVLKMTNGLVRIAKFQRAILFHAISDFCGEDTARKAIEAADKAMVRTRRVESVT